MAVDARGNVTNALMAQPTGGYAGQAVATRGGVAQAPSPYGGGFTSFAPRPPQAAPAGGGFTPPPGAAGAGLFAPPPAQMAPAMASGGFTAQGGAPAIANPAGANALMNQQTAAQFAPGSDASLAKKASMAATIPQSYWDNLMAQRANPQGGGLFAAPPAAGAPMPSNVVPRPQQPFKQTFSPGALQYPGGNPMRGRGF